MPANTARDLAALVRRLDAVLDVLRLADAADTHAELPCLGLARRELDAVRDALDAAISTRLR